jgi:hypothetical protein
MIWTAGAHILSPDKSLCDEANLFMDGDHSASWASLYPKSFRELLLCLFSASPTVVVMNWEQAGTIALITQFYMEVAHPRRNPTFDTAG